MQALGLPGTRLRRHMMDTAAARRGDENVSTPDELVRLLEAMHPMRAAKTAGCGRSAREAQSEPPAQPRCRPMSPSADKSGELEGVRVDAGIVYAKNRPFIICMMTTYLKSETEGRTRSRRCRGFLTNTSGVSGRDWTYGRQVGR